MSRTWHAAYAICALVLAAPLLLSATVLAGETPRAHPSLWFDPTQLPSFRGLVERYLPNPNGHSDRLMFKEGSQIVFPPEALAALEQTAPAGKELVVWGIRARTAPVITMLAFAAPDGEPMVLDRFYWRPARGQTCSGQALALTGKVRAPYLTPEGVQSGAILEDGNVIRVDPEIAETVKDRFGEHAKVAAEGRGCVTVFGKAIDARRIGESLASLQDLPQPSSQGSDHRR